MRASDADREQVAQVLHQALSEGRITMTELEERLSTVYAAKTVGELKPVTRDLPVGNPTPTTLQPATSRALGMPDNRIGGHPGSNVSVGVLSGAIRKGSWVLPPQHTSVAFWGGTQIDLRSARFADKQSTITAVAVMGGIEITVPDDINVDVTGIGFMGGFVLEDKSGAPPASPTAPTVTINGLAFWGGVVVYRKKAKKDSNPQIES
ncbi:DUF1707 domain-containing protein [Amycolatopsis sp. FDAARGOS 1241]|uniref:DUF1707 SHOCT-like domain-containing protein n=1 Tax=Amycolatopsis sp. FDAARGOS 1241 TaxID=2778070 RepID=UPI00194F290F|nr:DUF1707 domain-containing protein [Amycolatopsis sp. FDAARGOS 1241]QRP51202.1 DUF1707 and DUF2154 domain-containing protein [Amycolatopsis sp. FDAARGOS 1241]